jgi:nicotinate-nucleotide pyrophosphorylase (carboxylating)
MFSHAAPPTLAPQVAGWLAEDMPNLDPAGFVVGGAPRSATVWIKSRGVLAGVPWADEIVRQCGCAIEWAVAEGTLLEPQAPTAAATAAAAADDGGKPRRIAVAVVTGPTNRLLQAERTLLNLLSRCSGVATASLDMVARAREGGYRNAVAGTRKTTPGFRAVEKYGMLVGGADAHRMDLGSGLVMLKDNHIEIATANAGAGGLGSRAACISNAVQQARRVGGFSAKIEVEARTYEDAEAAVEAGADVVMLDNFEPGDAESTAFALREAWGAERKFLIEVSGGITLETIGRYTSPLVDVISTSAIHQGVPHVDYSMKLDM